MNVERLRKVRARILREPKRFYMGDWAYRSPACGTVCCIAGWATVYSRDRNASSGALHHKWLDVDTPNFSAGRSALGLTAAQAKRLFYMSGWPKRFANEYYAARTNRSSAKVAADRIAHFIKTKGRV